MLTFREKVEPYGRREYRHVVYITMASGVVSRQRDMISALSKRFRPLFAGSEWTEDVGGKLYTTCTDHSRSTGEWRWTHDAPYTSYPGDGIPAYSRLPGGSVGAFLLKAFASEPVELADADFKWRPAPGLGSSVSFEVWQLDRVGDADARGLGAIERLKRSVFGEAVADYLGPVGVRHSRR